MKYVLIPLVVIATLLSLTATVFAAPSNPDSITFTPTDSQSSPSVQVFRDLNNTNGNLLIIAQYDIAYATLPDDAANINFIGRIYDGSTILGNNTPYPYNDSGYGQGIISFYLTAAQTNAAGYTTADGHWITWPLTSLNVELMTNPTIFSTQSRVALEPIGTASYSTASPASDEEVDLSNTLIAMARGLEADWGTSLVDTNGRLNTTAGGPYFQLAIPNSLNLAPDAFGESSQSPVIPTPQPTLGAAGTLANTAAHRFDGTWWLTPQFTLVDTAFGWPSGLFASLVSVGLIFFCGWLGGNRPTGFDGGGATYGLMLGSGVILPIFSVLGFLGAAMGLMGFAILVVGGVIKIANDHLW